MTLEALINCDFSGDVMEGVNRAEEFIRDAYLLRDMRKDYDLFNRQLSILGTEKETFENISAGRSHWMISQTNMGSLMSLPSRKSTKSEPG